MNIIRFVLQWLYTIYAVSVLFVTMVVCALLMLPVLVLRGAVAQHYVQFILKLWCYAFGIPIGIFYRSRGREVSDPKQPSVLIVNHSSYLDPAAAYSMIRHSFRPLAKKELLKIPIYNQIVKASAITVDRSSPESRKASFEAMKAALKKHSVLIYPEGTQNRTGNPLKDFYDGAFRLAIGAQAPVQPIVCINAIHLLPTSQFNKMRPGILTMRYLPPIPTTGMTEADLPTLKEKVYSQMEAVIRKYDRRWRDQNKNPKVK